MGALHRRPMLVVGILAALVGILSLLASRHGPGISPDSVTYLSTAQHLHQYGELTNLFGVPLTVFPPGYPIILAGAAWLGISLQGAVVALNVLAGVGAVIVSYHLSARSLGSQTAALLIALLTATAAGTAAVFSMAWTEPWFTTICLGVLLLAVRFVTVKARWATLISMSLLISVATSLRYAGAILIIVALTAAVLPRASASIRALRLAVAVVLSAIGLVAIGLRNHHLGVSVLGQREPGGFGPGRIAKDTFTALGLYWLPGTTLASLARLLAPVIACVLIALVIAGVYRTVTARSSAMAIIVVFAAVYWLAIWGSEATSLLDPVSVRLSAPAIVPMLILAAYGAIGIRQWIAGQDSSYAVVRAHDFGVAAVVLVLAVAVASALQAGVYVHRAWKAGVGYNSVVSRQSALTARAQQVPDGTVIAATDPWQMNWNTGRSPVKAIPLLTGKGATNVSAKKVAVLVKQIRSGEVRYLAYGTHAVAAATPDVLRALGLHVHMVAVTADGTLYAVTAQAIQ